MRRHHLIRLSSSLLLLLSLAAETLLGQCVSLTALNTAATENFNTLASSGTANTALPSGWKLAESGASARNDGGYAASTGSDTAGDVYSFGAASNSERAFGTLRSGTLSPTVGACFTNNTGAAITSLAISYTGEMWRAGVANRNAADSLTFSYSLDATSLTAGSYTGVAALDLASPATSTAVGAKDGNSAAFRAAVSSTISSLNIPAGGTFYIRWQDVDIASSDDGLAIDDFSLTPQGAGAAQPSLTISDAAIAEGNTGTTTLSFNVGLSAVAGPGGVSFSYSTADGTATSASGDYMAVAGGTGFIAEGGTSTTVAITINADTAAEDDETFTVTLSSVTGATVARAAATGRILNDDVPPPSCTPTHSISQIQGNGGASALAGSAVTTRGIVTARKSNGYFLQMPAPGDSNSATSDGIFVFTGSTLPLQAVAGNDLCIQGTVTEFVPSADLFQRPLTQLTSTTVTAVMNTGVPRPAAVTISAADTTNAAAGLEVLEHLEGMRVTVNSLLVVGPTLGNVNEPNATATSSGVFYGVVQGVARPFREPGVQQPDTLPAGAPANGPRFDTNPERLRVDSDGQPGTSPLDVGAGALVGPITGVLDYGFRTYTILPDPGVIPVVGGASISAAPAPLAEEITVASFNMERFFDTVNDPAIGEPVLTAAAFANRLNKASLLIRTVLQTPDVIGVQEVENLSTLQSVAAKVNADAAAAGQANPNYQAFLVEGNDVGGIDVGFLVKTPHITVVSVTQEGKTTTYTDPNNGQPALLNDRPPLILQASATRAGSDLALPFTVIVNHLRSLGSIDDPVDGNRVRTKRRAQAEYLANLIQARLTANPGEHIVSVGDYNAFQFNDGYVDSIGTIRGAPTPADQVVLASGDLVNPDLTDLVDTLAAAERRSYSFDGNAQVLDHIILNANALARKSRFVYTHANADFPETARNNPNTPERLTDHDQPVVYLTLPFNRRPAGASQTEYVVPGSTKTFALNLSDPDGDSLTLQLVTPPSQGSVAFNAATRQATYAANAAASGADSFTYRATDTSGLQATFTVTIGVLTNVDATIRQVSQTGVTENPPCAPGKIFRINAMWLNAGARALNNVTAKVTQLSAGNALVEQSIGQTADNIIAVNEQFPGQFRIQLAACASFQFKVSLYGNPLVTATGFQSGSRTSRTGQPAKAEFLGDLVITADPQADDSAAASDAP